ncbi:hypothetical protein [Dickeya lacustris]|uniref:hypothetical protein n=1 Tax=Dickeya lacustris TaxID=2259638 RepID=UPI0022BA5750|nr:hypothetical protein [Dickeya lacustris]
MSTAQRALIIGASRGLGLGIATALYQRGDTVCATRRHPSASTEALPVRWLSLDINDAAQREPVVWRWRMTALILSLSMPVFMARRSKTLRPSRQKHYCRCL